jgi:ABC-type transporter Mla maintaining outer membrane lipid asymmetry ATPase subunit MlaF
MRATTRSFAQRGKRTRTRSSSDLRTDTIRWWGSAASLVLDEATSSLDSITEHHIQEAIANVMAERTAILIAHRLSTVRQCDRILVFDRGRIVEQGTHDALMAQETGVYRRLFDMQSLGFIDMDAPAGRSPARV